MIGAMPPRGATPAFVERARIDAVLRALVPDAGDRAFVIRCVLEEGPAHHRGANYVLLAMLGELVSLVGADSADMPQGDVVPVAMRVPPHLASAAPQHYPLGIPRAPLEALAGGDLAKATQMAAALSDGPPQHALANAAMVTLLAQILEKVRAEASR